MSEKTNWTKMGVFVGILAILTTIALYIFSLTTISDAQRYFGVTIIIFVAMFIYFQAFKEYPTSRSK